MLVPQRLAAKHSTVSSTEPMEDARTQHLHHVTTRTPPRPHGDASVTMATRSGAATWCVRRKRRTMNPRFVMKNATNPELFGLHAIRHR